MTDLERVEWVPGQQPLPGPDWCSWCGHPDTDHRGELCDGLDPTPGDPMPCDCDHWVPDDGPVPQPVTAQPDSRYL